MLTRSSAAIPIPAVSVHRSSTENEVTSGSIKAEAINTERHEVIQVGSLNGANSIRISSQTAEFQLGGQHNDYYRNPLLKSSKFASLNVSPVGIVGYPVRVVRIVVTVTVVEVVGNPRDSAVVKSREAYNT